MTIFQGVILNGTEVINAPTIVGNTVFQTTDQTITFGTPLAAASTRLSQDTTRAQLLLGLGTALGNQFVIGENAWIGHDYDHAAAAYPVLYIHGAADPDVSPTHWISVAHDATNGVITTGFGDLTLSPQSTITYSPIFYANQFWVRNSLTGLLAGAVASIDAIHIAPNNNDVVIVPYASRFSNYLHPAQVNPTLFVNSATDPAVNSTQWISMTHDQTNGVITTGKGSVSINVPLITDQLLCPTGSLILQPGISFVGIPDTGLGANVQNLTFWESGSIVAVASLAGAEIRIPSGYSFSFSSANDNTGASDTRISRGTAAGSIGDIILDSLSEVTEVCGVGLKTKEFNATLNDDATISLPAGTGWGTFMIGDNQEFARVRWTAAAVVYLDEGTANVAIADTDTFFCIYDGGATVTVKNRLGANLTLRGVIHYS